MSRSRKLKESAKRAAYQTPLRARPGGAAQPERRNAAATGTGADQRGGNGAAQVGGEIAQHQCRARRHQRYQRAPATREKHEPGGMGGAPAPTAHRHQARAAEQRKAPG